MSLFFPHERPENLYWIFCWHGGGFSGGEPESCFGQGFTSYSPVALIQLYLDTLNPVGGKGIGIIEVDSLLATEPGVNTFPAFGWQSPKCAVWYALANQASFGGNWSIVGNYGPSAGGTTSWWVGQTSDALYAASCPTSPRRPPGGYRTVAAWPAMVLGVPVGNAMIDHTNAMGPSGLYHLLNADSVATVRSQDAALNASPNSNITQANYEFLAQPLMMQFGETDTLVEPTWNSGAGGNSVEPMDRYREVSPSLSPVNVIYANCGHMCDLGELPFAPSVTAAFNFLLRPSPLSTLPLSAGFAAEPIGVSSATRPISVTNTASGPVMIGRIAIVGAGAGDFAQTDNCPLGPATLAVYASCTIDVTFRPSALGQRSAAIMITDDSDAGTQLVGLIGDGVR